MKLFGRVDEADPRDLELEIGVVVLTNLLDSVDLTRTMIDGFILVVWALQLWWSPVWLAWSRYGPAERAWRVATYRRR